MHQPYTPDCLVQMLYRELPAEAVQALTLALAADEQMLARYRRLRAAKQAMPKVAFEPSPSVIARILQYSAETSVEAPC